MPRELVVSVDGNICQRPAREYLALREETGDRLISGSSITAELPFFFESDAVSESFELRFEGILEMLYADGSFTLRFINEKAGGGRDVRRVRIEKLEKIEVIADMSSLEIYLNCGNKVMSSRFYPDEPEIRLASDSIDGKVYRMRGMEVHSDE
jgi:beta-fructofuranosidase